MTPPSPPGGPVVQPGADAGLRARALAAAYDILTEGGVSAVSVRTIARRAGIGSSSMYYYFPNKAVLLVQIALGGFEALVRELERPSDPDPAAGPFANAARGFVDAVTRRPRLFDLMFDGELMAAHEPLRAAERRAFTAFAACVAGDPRFPPAVAEPLALTFWTLGRGITATALSSADAQLPVDFRASVGEALAYLIDRHL